MGPKQTFHPSQPDSLGFDRSEGLDSSAYIEGVKGGTIIKQDNFVVFPALGYWEIDGKPVSKM